MEFRTASADFSAPLRGSGPRTVTQPVVFPRTIQHAAAGLAGYTLAFEGDDHHVGKLECRVDTEVNDNVAVVTATLGVRDWSGDWDDNYQGSVQFTVLAELASATGKPPRGDVIVSAMEVNQAVQFFRSSTYLDPAHMLPDNAIRLVGRKDTGVRVYVDYDASAGLPPISRLTGNLRVESQGAVLDLSPINAGQAITPRPDALINMTVADHTLNFMIPGAWCEGTVTLTCQVWDLATPEPKSAAFERSAVFTDVRPLNIYVVGIGYTAVTPALAAPTQANFTAQSLPALTKTYPIGDVAQSGFTTITFGETVTGLIKGGCTTGFNHVLDRLRDIRGGSSDIVVGVLPAGIVFNTPGNQIGGCGNTGVAAIFLDLAGDLPHEVGHSLGRNHAPCTMNRCNPAPANVDPGYPQYGTFPSDSIGVFGFDATANTVFDPASTFDFMAYSFPQWVSAYTYTSLAGASFPPTVGPGSGGGGAIHLQNVYREYLHLGLTLERDGTIRRRPSFHHPGYPPVGGDDQTNLTIEIADADGEVLVCQPLSCGCEDGCGCWPKDVRQALPWPETAASLRIWEDRDLRYEEAIPEPPEVRITGKDAEKDGIRLTWSAGAADEPALWYLVHWWDRRARVWRGLSHRQQETSLLVPYRLFRGGAVCVRVLATSGLATGFAEERLSVEPSVEPDPEVVITTASPEGGGALRAAAFDQAGRQLPAHRLTWYDGSGAEIGRGSTVDVRGLRPGQQAVKAVYRGGEHRIAAAGVVVDVGPEGRSIIVGTISTRAPSYDRPHEHPHPAPEPPEEDCFGQLED